MSDELTKKEVLVNKAVDMGLGDRNFLSKTSEENLQNMISLVESKDGTIKSLKSEKTISGDNPKVIRVKDLVSAGRIGVVKVEDPTAKDGPVDPEEDE